MIAHRIRVGLAVSALGLAALTGTAVAQDAPCLDSSCQPQVSEVLGEGATAQPSVVPGAESVASAPAAAATAPSGSLPFTGGDVAGLVLMGGAAIGAGALMIRRSRTRTQQ